MPAQDVDIRVRTIADTSGIAATKAQLAELKSQAATPVPGGLVEGKSAGVTGFESARVAAAKEALAVSEQQAAIESQIVTIAETKLAIIQAQAEGNAALVAELTSELQIRTAVLAVMKTKNIAQADLVALTQAEETLLAGVTAQAEAAAAAMGAVAAETEVATSSSLLMGQASAKHAVKPWCSPVNWL